MQLACLITSRADLWPSHRQRGGDQRQRPRLRVLLVAGLLAAAAPAGCAEPSAPFADAGQAAQAPDLQTSALLRAFSEAQERCRLSDFGGLTSCEDQQDDKLAAAEQAGGTAATLRTYCQLLQTGAEDHRQRLLAANRLNRLGSYLALQESASDEALLGCLLQALPRQKEPLTAQPLARAAAFLAGAAGQQARLWSALEQSAPAAQAAGYGAVWATGRTQVLDRLAQLLRAAPTPALEKAVILGFARGGPLASAEQQQVCQLLGQLLSAKPATAGACTAAWTMAELCPEQRQELLETSAARLASASPLDTCWLQALVRTIGRHRRSSSSVQQRRAIQGLAAVIGDEGRSEHVRQLALESLWQLDRQAAAPLARRLVRSSSAHLRERAAALLRRR